MYVLHQTGIEPVACADSRRLRLIVGSADFTTKPLVLSLWQLVLVLIYHAIEITCQIARTIRDLPVDGYLDTSLLELLRSPRIRFPFGAVYNLFLFL